AQPARQFIEARGGVVRVNALARVSVEKSAVAGIDGRGERLSAGQGVAAVPRCSLDALLAGELAPMAGILDRASRMDWKPIVTVNLWYDRVVMDEAFVGLPGRRMQWVFDKRRAFGEGASHLSLVASGADALVGEETDRLIAMAAAEVGAS